MKKLTRTVEIGIDELGCMLQGSWGEHHGRQGSEGFIFETVEEMLESVGVTRSIEDEQDLQDIGDVSYSFGGVSRKKNTVSINVELAVSEDVLENDDDDDEDDDEDDEDDDE